MRASADERPRTTRGTDVSEPKKPTPQGVSLFLGHDFKRSERCGPTTTPGFVVRRGMGLPGQVHHVAVEYEPGTRINRSATSEGLLKLKQMKLSAYQEHLERRYRVTRNDHDGPNTWDTLLVWEKDA